MSAPTMPRSPEQVLSTISATARIEHLVAPRRISFDEAGDGHPLSVLSLTWPSLDAMRPWLGVFAIDAHRPDAATVYGDYAGWSLMLSAPDACACPESVEVVHQVGYDADPYLPVAMPTGDTANRDECARLYDEHHRLTTADVLTVDPDLTDDGRGNPGMAQLQRQPYASDQYLYAEAPERIQTQRDDETFAEIVAEVHGV